jgi:hypothetical protein
MFHYPLGRGRYPLGRGRYPLGRGRYPLGRGRYSMAGCITVTLVCNLIVRESNEGEDYHAK